MKKFVFLCVFFAFSLSSRAQDSGIRFFHGTWDEAIEKLERLIAAKKKRLNWIRANILTGKVFTPNGVVRA